MDQVSVFKICSTIICKIYLEISNTQETISDLQDKQTVNPEELLNFIKAIDIFASKLRDSYFKDGSKNYGDLNTRLAYVKVYLPIHARLFNYCLSMIDDFFNNLKEIQLVSFGAGPGTDALGAWLYFLERDSSDKPTLKLKLFDINKDWTQFYRLISDELNSSQYDYGYPFPVLSENVTYDQMDITVKQDQELLNFDNADIVSVSFLLSEIMRPEDGEKKRLTEMNLTDNFVSMLKSMRNGSKFIIVDINETEVKQFVETIISRIQANLGEINLTGNMVPCYFSIGREN